MGGQHRAWWLGLAVLVVAAVAVSAALVLGNQLASGSSTATVRIVPDSPPGACVEQGEIEVKTLEAVAVPSPGVCAATVDVFYDPDVKRAIGCEPDPGGRFDTALCNTEFANKVRFTGIKVEEGPTGTFPLAEITFRADGGPGESTVLDVVIETFGDCPDAKPIDVEDDDGQNCIGCSDTDGDTLCDEVDLVPLTYSSAFSDVLLGGTTFGEVSDRGGLTVRIREEPNPDGVRIVASGSGAQASVSVCNVATLTLETGDDVVVTCGSAVIEVVVGPVEATFGPFGALLPAETKATIVESPPGVFEVQNSPQSAVPIIVNGIQIPPGGTEKDDDADGFFTSAEQHVGTDPQDACPDVVAPESGAQCGNGLDDDGDTRVDDGCPPVGPFESGAECENAVDDDGDTVVNDGCPAFDGDDAWPPDVYIDRNVDIIDVLLYKGMLGYCESEPGFNLRYDLDMLLSPGCSPEELRVDVLDVLLYKPVLGASCSNP